MNRSPKFAQALAAYNADDTSLALRLMEECAESDEAAACFLMALWCAGKEGMPVDEERSSHWLGVFKELAEQGDLEAQWDLAQNYRFGNLLRQDSRLANEWLERAANGGHGEAQHHLAWYYETGQHGYPLDKALAESWYQKAFEQEHPETLYLFAVRKFQDGVPTDYAMQLLRKAASMGFEQAGHVLAAHQH
jgi:uncharacterized protein